ncbi:MAG TPA: protein-arginine deiminase family protein [Thermoanaerobaculia bacterium]|nr:protein-arginine deiminase family protein [Thermoanaerobaculia bacterium]
MPDLELHADFDRDGRVSGTPAERTARQAAPGAVVVANLDVDRRALPPQVAAGPDITLDYAQPTKPAADDEVLPLHVRVVNAAALPGVQFLLRFPGIHSVRMRVYDDRGIILPSIPPVAHERPLAFAPAQAQLDLRLEARTVPGSPFARATLFDTRFEPDAVDESGFAVELVGRDAAHRETVHDRAQFSVAPVLFLDNGARAVRLYICDLPDNQASLADVRAALQGVAGLQLVTVPVDVAQGDTWLQDQFQAGIVVGADGWRHLIVHLPRLRSNFVHSQPGQNLARFVRSHFPARNVGVMDDFWQRRLVFADAAGRQQEIPFSDCIALAEAMQKVFALLELLNRVLSRLDRAWQPRLDLTWSDARLELPRLVAVLRRRVREALSGASDERRAVLEAARQDAETRLRQLEGALPLAGERFRLPAGRGTMEVDAQRADELFVRLNQFRRSSNYGGNIEVAPPTAGAPLGTIVVGNTLVHGVADFVDPDLLRFLHKQRKQPVVQLDTSWLDVGHIDELLSFVPNRRGGTPTFAALRASPGLAMALLRAANRRYVAGLPSGHPQQGEVRPPSGVLDRLTRDGSAPVTRLLRGKLWSHVHPPPQGPDSLPDVLEPPRIYQRLAEALNRGPEDPTSAGVNIHDIHYWPGEGPDRAYPADISVRELLFCERDDRGRSVNDFIETRFLQSLHEEVDDRFGAPVFPLPVLFDRVANVEAWGENPWQFSTSAFSPDLVNLQVVNGRLLVPRPYGPRMRRAEALALLREVLGEVPGADPLLRRLTQRFLQRPELAATVVWIHRQPAIHRPISAIGTVRGVFQGITTLRDVAKLFEDGFPGARIADVEQQVRAANQQHFDGAGRLRDGWRRFVVREGTVDLFEAVVRLVADELGLALHFVDAWFYHVHFGEIHCGTNVLRVPERGLPRWWDVPDAVPVQTIEFDEEETGG